MYQFIEQTLQSFRNCFSRKAAFQWFAIIVIALMIRGDHLGVTSAIRDLFLEPGCYGSMIHFFHSSAWNLASIRKRWYSEVKNTGLIYQVNGRNVIVGDGVKQSKEAFKMPGVKKLYQESEDSSKASYIYGHLFGAVGVIIGDQLKSYCVPLRMSIQDGLKATSGWKDCSVNSSSHVIQMIDNGYEVAAAIGKSIYLLDRYFLTVPALKYLTELNEAGEDKDLLVIVTKAKSNCTAFELPDQKEAVKRGRPRKKGKAVRLSTLFSQMELFTKADVTMYGDEQCTVYYLVKDLLWGQKHYQKLRFVLVDYDGLHSILVSTDLTMQPETIIELYSKRFGIETSFRTFKQLLGGFGYHFWTSFLDRLNHYKKKDEPDNLEKVTDEEVREHILQKIKAIEGFVQFACIALGILQICALRESPDSEIIKYRYLRTQSATKLSEATVSRYLQKSLFVFILKNPETELSQLISSHQRTDLG